MPFSKDTDAIPAGKPWMINFPVTEMDALLSAPRAAGIGVVTNPEWDTSGTGRIARVHAPEGAAVALWEPPAE
jgi:predicted enzyme related to lactoylglutathione lyase